MTSPIPLRERLAGAAYFLGWLFGRVGYVIRPYDMLADRRRWFWQKRQRCGAPATVINAIEKELKPSERTRQR